MFDDDDNVVDTETARRCYEEWSELIQYCDDIESGLIIMTHTEYERMPAIMLQVRRIFKEKLQAFRNKNNK